MQPSLRGKIAIVTGAGRGIGRAVALALGEAGIRVALAARSEEEIRSVAQEIRRKDSDAIALAADLTRDADMERIVKQTVSEWGDVDILVNNAGWGKTSSVVNSRVEDWDRTFQINLRAPMVLTRLLLPAMIEKKFGAIINIGSISSKAGQANTSAYSASKFGILGFTQSLFEEVREYGIKVSIILPGFVDTPLIPVNKRLDRSKMIQPRDIGDAVLYVLSTPSNACPVEMTIRPQQTPYR
ncbi:MAG TPA: SDR family oxidoreductase [Verrucomicrobiae bacterium]|jgi:3-oxoacyl-[acyl-carrier protein] reductase|nr:SDR family oxidoreductase [Verrucomicrobiae bacterium]